MCTRYVKTIAWIMLVILVAGCGSPAAPMPAPATGAAVSPTATPELITAERLARECARAMGGVEKIDSIKTMRFTEKLPDRPVRISEIKRPNLVKTGGVWVFDGKRAALLTVSVDGRPGVELVPEEEWYNFEMGIAWQFPAFFDYPAKYLGTEIVDQIETHKLGVILPLGTVMTYYLDARTYLIYMVASDVTIDDQAYHWEITYSDYRLQDGILYPHTSTALGADGVSVYTSTVETVEFNVPFEDEYFSIPTLTSSAAAVLTPTPSATIAPTEESLAGDLSEEEAATLSSLEQVDEYPLYTMRYYGAYDYRLSSIQSVKGLASADLSNPNLTVSPPTWACSLFAALGDADNMLYGRNFDWSHSPAVLLFTDPPDGYASVSMVDITYLGFEGPKAGTLTDLPLIERRTLLDAPSLPFDGMNERGLAIGMAAVPPGNMLPDPNKGTTGSLEVIRKMLDYASNVDEAVAILQSYNITFASVPLHYLIADSSGRSVLVEFYQGEMVVIPNKTPWHLATNFLRASAGESAGWRCWRYDEISQRLAKVQGQLATQDALDLLKGVAQPNTQWSIVYGMDSGDISVVMGQKYDNLHTFHLSLTGE